MKVKICGITRVEDALAACEAGADALGFNFSEAARRRERYIDPEKAVDIIDQLPPFVTIVGVTVDEFPERLREYLQFCDYVQLHGDEPPDICFDLGRRAIKAFRAGPDFVPEAMLHYEAAAYLIDAHAPGEYGGTGRTADWDAAKRAVALGRPVILAGGLTPENVAEAVKAVRPYAVDTAGGVESAPGKKDHARIRDFIRNAQVPLA